MKFKRKYILIIMVVLMIIVGFFLKEFWNEFIINTSVKNLTGQLTEHYSVSPQNSIDLFKIPVILLEILTLLIICFIVVELKCFKNSLISKVVLILYAVIFSCLLVSLTSDFYILMYKPVYEGLLGYKLINTIIFYLPLLYITLIDKYEQ